ncbi:hypothetical protein ACFPFV_12360 [Salinicoccus siamensis]
MARAFDTLKPVYDKLGIEQQPIAPVARKQWKKGSNSRLML